MVQRTDKILSSFDTHLIEPPLKLGNGISLVQIADIIAENGWNCAAHVQFCHEIVLVLEGDVMMSCNSERFVLHAGQFVVIPKGFLHDYQSTSSDSMRMQVVGLHFREDIEPFFEASFAMLKNAPVNISVCPVQIQMLFDMLIQEYFHNEDCSIVSLQSILYLLLKQVSRKINTQRMHEAESSLPAGETNDPLTLQIAQYIKAHAESLESLVELSDVFLYSYSYLSHHFKSESGYTLMEYWEHFRFQYIVTLMRDTKFTLTQIAEKTHYQSIHTFSRSFRKHFGVPPSEYRARLLNRGE